MTKLGAKQGSGIWPALPEADAVRYNSVARALHWAIALLILFNLTTGIIGESIEKIWVVWNAHKATGFVILALSLVRIAWRLTWRTPPYPLGFSPVQRKLAAATHGVFYLLMIILPVTGWVFSSASPWPLSFYGLAPLPKLPVHKGMAVVDFAHGAHTVLGYGFAALVALHIAAALYHHFALKDPTLRRMV